MEGERRRVDEYPLRSESGSRWTLSNWLVQSEPGSTGRGLTEGNSRCPKRTLPSACFYGASRMRITHAPRRTERTYRTVSSGAFASTAPRETAAVRGGCSLVPRCSLHRPGAGARVRQACRRRWSFAWPGGSAHGAVGRAATRPRCRPAQVRFVSGPVQCLGSPNVRRGSPNRLRIDTSRLLCGRLS